MPQKREGAAEKTDRRTILCIFSAELTSSCGGHDTKMRELEGGLEMVADGTRWRWRGREGRNETKRQSEEGEKNLAIRDAEMLEFGIKRASCTQVWRPTSRRAPLQFASLWIANKKEKRTCHRSFHSLEGFFAKLHGCNANYYGTMLVPMYYLVTPLAI